ncbi:cytochrome c oxidase accessory protein CcoG [Chryseobacterium wangxinyae]|uniref:cytochrome c oxidase accessory protein CcoG n=1 Tax=Chryseobacterium sp. CY350 TaxID=2997336 RepID=UPI00226FD0DA|nr:cytochrome c oxidase accessory protein CcoG [Chryseobacterium sp. CY350]MCY0977315.1 cytochrome c oxidase accessory protein CcoG [Chryseobacterium sp. CY350]WBZ95666.1 cytochrome c oxidase accessory protein CcoG [Chryseobacterium sp. CY350]
MQNPDAKSDHNRLRIKHICKQQVNEEDAKNTSKPNSQNRLFPRKPRGSFTKYRSLVAYFFLILFFAIPFLAINGNPVLLFDVEDRQLFIAGKHFYPQDFFILTLAAIIFLMSIIIFTIAFGRVFCGWMCPQTIMMENVFRKIEYSIEGDRLQQIKLNQQNWDLEKISKKGLKWTVFFMVSLTLSIFTSLYFLDFRKVFTIINDAPFDHPTYFATIFLLAGVIYYVFSFLREKVCTLVCPYGILQGIVINRDTMNVFYDYKIGENRSPWNKSEDRKAAGKGNCIDCKQCVTVCPMGIDIRNGQQLECIHCTACIDACDEVMDKAGLPKGLIRYSSEKEIETQQHIPFIKTKKTSVTLLIALQFLLLFIVSNDNSVEARLVKPDGTSFFFRDDKIINSYHYTIINKSDAKKITLKVLDPSYGEVTSSGSKNIILNKDDITKGTINIRFPRKNITLSKQNIRIGIFDDRGILLSSVETYFEGPFKLLNLN